MARLERFKIDQKNNKFIEAENSGHGKAGQIRKGSWFRRTVTLRDKSLNRGSVIDHLNAKLLADKQEHEAGSTRQVKLLNKGFLGFIGGSSEADIKKIFDSFYPESPNAAVKSVLPGDRHAIEELRRKVSLPNENRWEVRALMEQLAAYGEPSDQIRLLKFKSHYFPRTDTLMAEYEQAALKFKAGDNNVDELILKAQREGVPVEGFNRDNISKNLAASIHMRSSDTSPTEILDRYTRGAYDTFIQDEEFYGILFGAYLKIKEEGEEGYSNKGIEEWAKRREKLGSGSAAYLLGKMAENPIDRLSYFKRGAEYGNEQCLDAYIKDFCALYSLNPEEY
jgi:hypothetical protein